MSDSLIDALIDTIKIIPYLFVAFLILEFLEHKLSHKNEAFLRKNKKYGPIIGGILGGLPQCGFSTMASSLFSSKVITMGTVVAVFLSTSDEMLPIMVSESVSITSILTIIGFKVLIGIVVGLVVDFIFKKKYEKEHIHDLCSRDHCDCEHDGLFKSSLKHRDHCDCEHDGLFKSSLKHTIKIAFFILIANVFINLIIFLIGEDVLKQFLEGGNIFTYFISSLIGLIPNCASSVIITELYLSNLISIGTLFSGLLTGSGIGLLLLFKNNDNKLENFTILGIVYFIGVFVGLLVDIIL